MQHARFYPVFPFVTIHSLANHQYFYPHWLKDYKATRITTLQIGEKIWKTPKNCWCIKMKQVFVLLLFCCIIWRTFVSSPHLHNCSWIVFWYHTHHRDQSCKWDLLLPQDFDGVVSEEVVSQSLELSFMKPAVIICGHLCHNTSPKSSHAVWKAYEKTVTITQHVPSLRASLKQIQIPRASLAVWATTRKSVVCLCRGL